MVQLAKANGARFLLDEAHGFGAMGPGGKGVAAHFGVSAEIDLLMGTFSKSFASIGGFAAGPRDVIDYVKHFGRSIIFTASLPPPNLAAVDAALTIMIEEPWRVEKLHANANYWRNGLKELGFDTGHSIPPVVPVRVGSEANAFVMWRALVDAGVYTNAVIYPAVPRNGAILRTSLTATHETWMLDKALAAFADMGRVLGLIR